MAACFRFFVCLIVVYITTCHTDCNLLNESQATTSSYIDTESKDSIISMCSRDPSTLSKWERYQCEYIQNRNGVKRCWPQRRMSHCTPGNLKGVIFLYHGFTACPNWYNEIADILQNECFHIYLPLTIGHGYNYCNSTDPPCFAGKYNLTNIPNSKAGYIDFVNMMIEVINDEVSIIKQCESNNDIQVIVGGLSLGAHLAAATVLLSGKHSVFTKQMLWSTEPLLTIPMFLDDDKIYKCLLNSPFSSQCLGIYLKSSSFVGINSITKHSNILSNIFHSITDSVWNAYVTFIVFINGLFQFFVENTSDLQLVIDTLDTIISLKFVDETDQCEDDIKYRDRGGFCAGPVRNVLAAYSFIKYIMELVVSDDDDDVVDYNNNIETLLILPQRDGVLANSFSVNFVNYFYNDNQQLIQNKTNFCMWLIAEQCKSETLVDNVCGVPHSFVSPPPNMGHAPFYEYWIETLMNGTISWLNDEETYNDNFMVPLDDWDGSRNQCVELDLIHPPKTLLYLSDIKSKMHEMANIDYKKILSNNKSKNIDQAISDFVDKLDVSTSIITLLQFIKKYYNENDIKLNDFHFHGDIIKRIQQNEDLRYWLWNLLDIKIDSIESLSDLLDKIFYKLSGRNLKYKIIKFADLFEEFEYWERKLFEVDIDSFHSLSELLDDILDTIGLDEELKDKVNDIGYQGILAKLKRIIYRIQNLGVMDDYQALEKQNENENISIIITLSITNLVVIILFIAYCCYYQQNTYQYQKVQSLCFSL